MRKEIERAIYSQSEAVKVEKEGAESDQLFKEAEEIFTKQTVLLHKLENSNIGKKGLRRAEHRAGNAFEKSAGIQRKKQEIMDRLRADLEELRKNPEKSVEISESGRKVAGDENGGLAIEASNGKKTLSFGDIIADREWGVEYNLDKSVPSILRKRYILECAKKHIGDLFNDQIVQMDPLAESIVNNKKILDNRIIARGEVKYGSDNGLLAERMAYSFFLRRSYGADKLFRALPTDVYGDVHDKIDFILKRIAPTHIRGIKTETVSGTGSTGIQFTINKNKNSKNIKPFARGAAASEESPVNDVVILKIRGEWPKDIFNKWLEAGRPSGGPEQFLEEDKKARLLRGALQKMLTPEEIEKYLEQQGQSKKDMPVAA